MGDAIADNVAWSYQQPPQPVAGIGDLIAFYHDKMDAWHEDG